MYVPKWSPKCKKCTSPNGPRVIEKYDSLEPKYLIVGTISNATYQKVESEVKKRARKATAISVQRGLDRFNDIDQKRNSTGGRRYHLGNYTTQYGRKDTGVQKVGRNQDERWKIYSDTQRSNERNGSDWENKSLDLKDSQDDLWEKTETTESIDAEATNGQRGEEGAEGAGASRINYALDENGMWEMEHIFENDDPEAEAAMMQEWNALLEKYKGTILLT